MVGSPSLLSRMAGLASSCRRGQEVTPLCILAGVDMAAGTPHLLHNVRGGGCSSLGSCSPLSKGSGEKAPRGEANEPMEKQL